MREGGSWWSSQLSLTKKGYIDTLQAYALTRTEERRNLRLETKVFTYISNLGQWVRESSEWERVRKLFQSDVKRVMTLSLSSSILLNKICIYFIAHTEQTFKIPHTTISEPLEYTAVLSNTGKRKITEITYCVTSIFQVQSPTSCSFPKIHRLKIHYHYHTHTPVSLLIHR